MVRLSATRCSCTAILWVSLVSSATITLCVASQWVFIAVCILLSTQSGNFWTHPHTAYRVHHKNNITVQNTESNRIEKSRTYNNSTIYETE
jgi:hypothetical protein